jgi:hypothetical protein
MKRGLLWIIWVFTWVYQIYHQLTLKTKIIDESTKTISVRLKWFGSYEWHEFRRSDKCVGWKYDNTFVWNLIYNNWIRLVVWDDNQDVTGLFDRQLAWCDKMLKHDWNTFNGCYWAFKNKQDAMMFRMVWGGEDANEHDRKMIDEEQEKSKKEEARHAEFNALVKNGTIDLNNLTNQQQNEWSDVLMDRMFREMDLIDMKNQKKFWQFWK